MPETSPQATLESLLQKLPILPETLSPPTSDGVYRLQELVNAPLPFMLAEEEGEKPHIIPWEVTDESGESRLLTPEEAAIQAVESVHDRMVQLTETMGEAGLSKFVPFGLLYEKLTQANSMAMQDGLAGQEDGIQDVVLNGAVVVKFADKFFNALDTVIEGMKDEPELGLEFEDSQKEHLHGLRVARYKRLGLIGWDDEHGQGELEPIPLKESWKLVSDVEKNMDKKLEKLPIWLLGSLGVSAHINADLIEALAEAGADNEYADEFAVVQKMLDTIGRVVLHEFGNFPGEKIDNAINSLTLFLVGKWRKEVFAALGRFCDGEATQVQLRDEADERAVKVGRGFMRVAKFPPIFVKTGGQIEEMRQTLHAMPVTV